MLKIRLRRTASWEGGHGEAGDVRVVPESIGRRLIAASEEGTAAADFLENCDAWQAEEINPPEPEAPEPAQAEEPEAPAAETEEPSAEAPPAPKGKKK